MATSRWRRILLRRLTRSLKGHQREPTGFPLCYNHDMMTQTKSTLDELLDELIHKSKQCGALHAEYMGKFMPDDKYEIFSTLRDEAIPRLKRQIKESV